MAVRTITTRLALDGEAEYKRQIQNINAEYRVFSSELQKLEAQFKGQMNSLDALSQKEAAMSGQQSLLAQRYQSQLEMLKKAQDAYNAQTRAVADLEKQYAALDVSTKEGANKQKKLGEELEKAKDKLQQAANSVTYYKTQINNTARDQINLDNSLQETRKYLDEAKNSADQTAVSIDGFGKQVKETTQELDQGNEAVTTTGDSVTQLAKVLQAAGVAAALHEISGAIWACVDSSIEFETAMASFNKVAKLSNADLSAMSEAIKTMSTNIPATTTEIAQVAEASRRLGVEKESLLAFTNVMVDLGNVSDLTAEQAATALARFANVVGTSADDYERLGSVIVALGNNFATSESEITEMASRLASAGSLAGLAEPEIMALAAAMSSVGIQAEAGGTAMTQTLTAMEKAVSSGGDKLDQFAKIAGMSAGEFAEAWGQDPMTAITAFIGGLGQLDEQGESATQVLEELGMSGVRQSNMLKSLALASETLTGTLQTANTAWDENTELAATAAERYSTTEAKMTMAANAANNLKIAIGDALIPALGELAEGVIPVIQVIETVIKDNPALVTAITALIGTVGLLTAGLTAYNVITGLAATATGALAAVMNAIPGVLVVSGILAVVAALKSFVEWLGRSKDETLELVDAAEIIESATAGAAKGLTNAAMAAMEGTEAYSLLQAAAGDAGPLLENLADRSAELEEATLFLAGANDTLSAALEEQSDQGRLSLQTTLDLIDAGYASAIAIDTETGAVTLNRDEYILLATAKMQEQIAALEVQKNALISAGNLDSEAAAARRDSSAYWDLAASKLAENAASNDEIKSLDAQIAALKAAQSSLGSYTGAVTTAARSSASASKTVKTQAQQDLETYKQVKAELDHLKSVDLVDEAEYYRKMAEYRDQYLTDDTNISEYRKVTEQIYKYDKSLAEQEAALWADQTDTLISELEQRVKSVTDQQDKMEDRLSGYGDLFKVTDNTMTLENIQEQIDAIDAYEQALNSLRERNISGGLMDEVLAMDVDSATQYANQLLAMSEDQWQQYNDLWDEKQQRAAEVAEQFFRDQLDALENEYNDKLGDALDNLTDTSFDSGVDTAQGLIDGLASMEGALYDQAQAMADRVSSILAGAGRIPSNSELAASFSTERIAERYQGVTNAQLQSAVVGGVNAMTTANSGGTAQPMHITIQTEDKLTIARAFVPDIRTANKENPETLDDK